MQKIITDSHRDEMNRNGYIILPRLFSKSEMLELDAALANYEVRMQRAGVAEREVDFSQKIAERDDAIRAFAMREEFVSISTSLLGPNVDLYFNQKVYKNPHGQTPFSWHQDDAYSPVEPTPYLTVWIAISEATQANGCISVLPGSHKGGLVPHYRSDFGLACRSMDDPDQGVLVPLESGSVACFWSLTMHKSGPNTTSETRKALVLQFAPEGMRHLSSGMAIRSRIAIARVPTS